MACSSFRAESHATVVSTTVGTDSSPRPAAPAAARGTSLSPEPVSGLPSVGRRPCRPFVSPRVIAVVLLATLAPVSLAACGTRASPATSQATAPLVTTLAGEANRLGESADGPAAEARFNGPWGIACDASGNLYVTDSGSDTIRRISPDGVVGTLAGTAGQQGSTDGRGAEARFDQPTGIAVDASGNLYVADFGNDTIRRISPDGVVSTLAGTAGQRGSTDGRGAEARFDGPSGVASDAAGNVYVADSGNQTIRRITPAGVVTTLAGRAGSPGSTDGRGPKARFFTPWGIACGSDGELFVTDAYNETIRAISPDGLVSTLAGTVGDWGSSDGRGARARFDCPTGIACDGAGELFVTDSGNNTIRMIAPNGAVSTLAGRAPSTVASADGRGRAARFNTPEGVAWGGAGTLYVTDLDNNTIRKISLRQ